MLTSDWPVGKSVWPCSWLILTAGGASLNSKLPSMIGCDPDLQTKSFSPPKLLLVRVYIIILKSTLVQDVKLTSGIFLNHSSNQNLSLNPELSDLTRLSNQIALEIPLSLIAMSYPEDLFPSDFQHAKDPSSPQYICRLSIISISISAIIMCTQIYSFYKFYRK